MANQKIIDTLRRNYITLAQTFSLKNSLYEANQTPPSSDQSHYYWGLWIIVGLMAGIITGFGAAAPIISAVFSFFPVITIQVAALALSVFLLYAIPWGMLYIPDVASIFRNWWESSSQKLKPENANSNVLDKANRMLAMLYRKAIRQVEKKGHNIDISPRDAVLHLVNMLINELRFDEKANINSANKDGKPILNLDDDRLKLVYRLNELLQANQTISQEALRTQVATAHLLELGHATNKQDLDKIQTLIQNQPDNSGRKSIAEMRLDYLDRSGSAIERTYKKQAEQYLWQLNIEQDKSLKQTFTRSAGLGSILGYLNATLAGIPGTALAPLYIAATLVMLYTTSSGIISMFIAAPLFLIFGLSGFVASAGLTKKSIEQSFVNLSHFFFDRAKQSRKRFKYSGSIYYYPFAYISYLFKRYSVIPITMSLILSLSLASFNFLAGVTFGHILLYPMLLTQPAAVASFSVTSLAALHPLEYFFGFVGMGFTLIAVMPLMVGAFRSFLKSQTLEPFYKHPWIALAGVVTTLVNTFLLTNMLLRPGSPLQLFFGSAPMFINIIGYVAPVCIFVLGCPLFYGAIYNLMGRQGRNLEDITKETLLIKDDFKRAQNLNAIEKCTNDPSASKLRSLPELMTYNDPGIIESSSGI